MTFLKNQTFNRRFFKAIGTADFAAQNCTSDKIMLSKQAFVAFSMEKKVTLALESRPNPYPPEIRYLFKSALQLIYVVRSV